MSRQVSTFTGMLIIGAVCSFAYSCGLVYYIIENYLVSGFVAKDGNTVGRDFYTFWTAAKVTMQNAASLYDPMVYANALNVKFNDDYGVIWPYAPSFMLFIYPFAFLPYKIAFVLWLFITAALFIAASVTYRGELLITALIVLLAPNITNAMFMGQNGLVTAALLIAGFRFASDLPRLSGFFFGLMIIKPQLALLVPVYLASTKNWNALIYSAITALCVIILSAAVFGIEPWSAYIHGLFSANASRMVGGEIQVGMPTIYMLILRLTDSSIAALIVQIICTILVVASAYWVFKNLRSQTLHILTFAGGMLLATPYAYIYDAPIIAYSMVPLITVPALWERMCGGLLGSITVFLVWFLPSVQMVLGIGSIVLLVFYLMTLSMAKLALAATK